MALSERLAYVLDFDVKGGIRSLEKVGQTAEKELGKAERKLDKISTNLTKFGTGAVAFAGVAGVALFKMGQGAAEAEASMAALEQVVGEVAAANVKEWAEDSADGVGLASKEAVAAATQFAGLGKIIGLTGDDLADFAKEHVELAADMAAFRDVSPQQAIEDLQSAYAGSTEVLRKYNIFLDEQSLKQAYARETGEEVTGTLTTQQKIIAINSELYRQGADMLGQWGRESGELAGQQATLSANLTNLSDKIGAGLLPMLTQVVGAAADAAGALASMDSATGGAIGRFAALGTAGVGLLGTLSLVAGQVIKMRDRFTTLGDDGTRSLNKLGVAAKGIGVAMGVASVALIAYSAHAKQVADRTAAITENMQGLSRATDQELVESFKTFFEFSSFALGGVEQASKNLAETNLEGAKRALDLADAIGLESDHVEALTAAIEVEESARAQAVKTAEQYSGATEEATEAVEDHTDKVSELNQWVDKAAYLQEQYEKATERAEAADEAAAEAAEERKQKLEALIDTIQRSIDTTFNYESASRDAERATNDYERAVENAAVVMADSEATARDKEEALWDVRDAEINAAEGVMEAARAFAEEQGAAEGSTESVRLQKEELQRLADKFPFLRDEIDLFIAKLNAIPSNKSVTVTVSQVGNVGVGGTIGGNSHSGVRAHGGPTRAGGLYEVGEGGKPELLEENGRHYLIPGNNGKVTPADKGGTMGGGSPVNITINGFANEDSIQQLTKALDEVERRKRGAL